MKNLHTKCVIFCAETVKACAAASENFLCFSKFVATPSCISLFLNERVAPSKKYQYATASERKCAAAS